MTWNSYLISDGVCYLTLTDKSYPKRLAFLFLEEISRDFVADLQEEYGDEFVIFLSFSPSLCLSLIFFSIDLVDGSEPSRRWVVNMRSSNSVSSVPLLLSSHRPQDRVIQKKRRDYLDPNSTSNMKKLNDDLQSIHNIMRKTIDDVLDRGNKLDGLSSPACLSHSLLLKMSLIFQSP
jgi:vesicle transport protein SEC22